MKRAWVLTGKTKMDKCNECKINPVATKNAYRCFECAEKLYRKK